MVQKNENVLQKSHERFLAVLNGLDAHVYVADMETYEILYMNKRMRDDFGDRLIGKLCWKEFRDDPDPCPHCTNDKLIDEHGNLLDTIIWEGQNPITGKWYLNNDQAITWVDGRPVRLQVALDITERKRTEGLLQALNQASVAVHSTFSPEEIFAAVAKEFQQLGLSSMILFLDETRTKLHIAHIGLPAKIIAVAQKLTGLNQETFSLTYDNIDVYRQTISERKTVFVENGEEVMKQALPGPLKALSGKLTKMVNFSRAIIAPLMVDDEVFGLLSVQADDLVIEDADAVTAFAYQISAAWHKAQLFEEVQTEIIQRRETENELRVEREKAQHYLDIAGVALLALDMDGTITLINPRGLEILGYQEGELIGRNWFETCLPERLREDVYRVHKKVMAGEEEGIEYYDNPILTKTGEERIISWRNSVLRNTSGEIIGTFSSGDDITDRVQADESLKQYSGKLEEMVDERTQELREAQEELVQSERLATLGQLGSGIAHELRNPLGVISNAVYFLKSSLTDADENTKEYLELISSEVGVSTQIITNLLNLSRKTDPIMKTVLLSELFTNVLERQPPPIEVEVSSDLDDDMSVHADPSHIVQVLVNIFNNAYQAMPKGGELTIKAHTENKYALITVTDTGAGIPKEILEKIFEPLFTTKARGIGLGLTLSKNLLEANGGSISVESVVGKGTTFTMKLQNVS